MSYTILFKAPAKAAVAKLDRSVRERILRALERIAETPSLGKPLNQPLAGFRSYRSGDWRIVYQIEQQRITVIVVAVGHRREIYDIVRKVIR